MRDSLYDKIPIEMLAGFYYYIKQNTDKGILSNAMHIEIKLIEQSAKRKGISLEELYEQGSHIIEIEKEKRDK